MRTIIYIDGFNLYYGCLKDSQYRWLDIKKLFSHILKNNHEIEKIRYFTARVKNRTNNVSASQRQQVYIRALEKSYLIRILSSK